MNRIINNKEVFINCPFDDDYLTLLKPLIYTLKLLGFIPRIASESLDSGQVRLSKIKNLIESTSYSIHDLSRVRAKKKREYFRMNMPFELGIDMAFNDYCLDSKYKKKILILEEEQYSTKIALSDLAYSDCKCHKGEALNLIYSVRDWFLEVGIKNVPSGSNIWDKYNMFYGKMAEEKMNDGYKNEDIDRMPIKEFMNFIDDTLGQE